MSEPIRAEVSPHVGDYDVWITQDGHHLATVHASGDHHRARKLADAFAAAPEMAEFLADFAREMEHGEGDFPADTILDWAKEARAALKKAGLA